MSYGSGDSCINSSQLDTRLTIGSCRSVFSNFASSEGQQAVNCGRSSQELSSKNRVVEVAKRGFYYRFFFRCCACPFVNYWPIQSDEFGLTSFASIRRHCRKVQIELSLWKLGSNKRLKESDLEIVWRMNLKFDRIVSDSFAN